MSVALAKVQLGREEAEVQPGKDFLNRAIMQETSMKRISCLVEKNIQIGLKCHMFGKPKNLCKYFSLH